MSGTSWAQLVTLIAALAVSVPFMARYLATVYATSEDGNSVTSIGDRLFEPIERIIYRMIGVDPRREQRWNIYAIALLAFSVVSLLVVYALERLQGSLPFNPTGVGGVHPYGAWNAAVSFMTNTNWQWYSGESVMSHLTQMVGLTVQNFVSAAAGMSVAVAIVRGLVRRRARTIGNFWVDLVRTVVRVLLPLAFVAAVLLVACGVIQNFSGYTAAHTVEQSAPSVSAATDSPSESPSTQLIPGGPVASQEAIKQLGSNGGGFFNVNSAHPFENPDGWSNLLGTYLILLIPLAFPLMFGRMFGQRRQGYVILGVMLCIWFAMTMFTSFVETRGNPAVAALGVSQSSSSGISAGNLEGKDLRFGPSTCALWTSSTTGTSNGSTNCSIDSMTPAGGGLPMLHIMLGEVSPGGVGVGLMTALIYAMLAVFLAGLMVGRTPEYLGKKIQATEMKLAVLFIIAMPMAVLTFAAISVVLPSALSSLINPGAHGLSTILYDYASAANNNGSAFAGLSAGTPWFTVTQGLSILIGRFFLIIPALAISGSLVRKNHVPATSGTFPTDTILFGALLVGVIVIVAGLTFFPALALGPIVEQLGLQ